MLGDLLTARQPRPITPQVILEATSKMFGIPVEEIIGKKRQRPLVAARQVAMYVIRDLTDLSYPAIAREFGGRDHTTVIHAVEKITNQMKQPPAHLRPGHRALPDHPGRGMTASGRVDATMDVLWTAPVTWRPPVGNLGRLRPDVPGTVTPLWDPVDPGGTAKPRLTRHDLGSSPIHTPYHHSFVAKHKTTVESEFRREVPMRA